MSEVKIVLAGYFGYFLKICTSENRTTEIRRSQGPCVEYLVATTLGTTTKTIMPLKVTHPAHETLICSL